MNPLNMLINEESLTILISELQENYEHADTGMTSLSGFHVSTSN